MVRGTVLVDRVVLSSFSRARCAIVLGLLSGALMGCPGKGGRPSAPAPCAKLGEQCQFEPGKLGVCAYRTNCEGPQCLHCQSQH